MIPDLCTCHPSTYVHILIKTGYFMEIQPGLDRANYIQSRAGAIHTI